MTIITRSRDNRRIEIDLSGPAGNAFNLLAVAEHLGDRMRLNVPGILEEMKGGDYDNLVAVFDRYFGSIVTLYRDKPNLHLCDDEEGDSTD